MISNPLSSVMVPRPTAWMSVIPSFTSEAKNEEPIVCLIEGYCGASDRPPTLMLGSDSIASAVLDGLRQNRFCALSVATEREWRMQHCSQTNVVQSMAGLDGENRPSKTFSEARLKECYPTESLQKVLDSLPDPFLSNNLQSKDNNKSTKQKRPPAVDSSPVQMHCRLITEVPLYGTKTMILLQVDAYVMHQSVLRKQTTLHPNPISIQGNPDVRKITAKIDCLLLAPLASLGNGKFGTVNRIYHMGRPRPKICRVNNELNEETCNEVGWEDGTKWDIENLLPAESNVTSELSYNNSDQVPVTYTYRVDHHCPLGYNPMKQVVCPRFVGWISTYEPASLKRQENSDDHGTDGPTAHISPYSFFMDVARGSRPMVAFAACPRSDEFDDSDDETNTPTTQSDNWKDAQRDAELTGCFCVNFVSQELAWAMNASAAPLGKGLSEFNLIESSKPDNDTHCNATIPTYTRAPSINAPMVNESPVVLECKYVKTTKIPDIFENDSMYSLIIGEVVNVHVKNDFVLESNSVSEFSAGAELDVRKGKPVARLGYGQEYAVIDDYLNTTQEV
ncbi:hypothetical protein ACHAXN_006468 [Cyclotella atomus]